MPDSDLDYAYTVGRLGIAAGDGPDDGDNPDIIWCNEGAVRFTPLQTYTKVSGAVGGPATIGQGVIVAELDAEGYIIYRGKRGVWLVDLTSEKVNPIIGPNKATHKIDFDGVKADGTTVDFQTVTVRLTRDGDGASPDKIGDGGSVIKVNDITVLAPIAAGSATPIYRGERGTGIADATVTPAGELELRLTDDTVINAGELPVGEGGSAEGVAGYLGAATGPVRTALDQTAADLAAEQDSEFGRALSTSIGEQVVRPASYYGVKPGTSRDNASAFADMRADLLERGGDVQLQPGVYLTSTPVVVPGSSRLLGVGMSYTSQPFRDAPDLGTIIRATPGASWAGRAVVELAGGPGASDTGNVSSSLSDITCDAAGIADWALLTNARRNHVHNLYALRGRVGGVRWSGQNGLMDGFSIIDQYGVGDCILHGPHGDNKFKGHIQARGFGPDGAGFHIVDGSDIEISGFHCWTGANGVSLPGGAEIWLDASTESLKNIRIYGGGFDGVLGPQVRFTAGAGKVISHVNITGNTFWFPVEGIPDGVVDAILFEGPGSIGTVTITGNTVNGADSTHRYRSFLHDAGTASAVRSQILVSGNTGECVMTPALAEPAIAAKIGSAMEEGINTFHDGSLPRRTTHSGTTTLTGDGTTTKFYITTRLAGAAKNWQVTPANAAAAAARFFVEATIGNALAVTFVDANGAPTAPPAGASLVLQWRATGLPTTPAVAPALGTDFVVDTFAGAAGTSLKNHVGETGATWNFFGSDLLKIDGANALHVTATSSARGIYLASGAPASADYTVRADVTVKSNIASEVIGPVVRASGVGSMDVSGYGLVHVGSGAGEWRLIRLSHVAPGPGTTLVTINRFNGVGETHAALLVAQGPFLTAFIDGVQVGQVFDATIAGPGVPGINWSGATAASDTTGAHLDNFRAAPLA